MVIRYIHEVDIEQTATYQNLNFISITPSPAPRFLNELVNFNSTISEVLAISKVELFITDVLIVTGPLKIKLHIHVRARFVLNAPFCYNPQKLPRF